jgi:hypothetical protein
MTTPGLHLLSEHRRSLSALTARHRTYLLLAAICLTAGLLLLAFDFTDAEALTVWAFFIMAIGLVWLIPSLFVYARSIKRVSIFEEGVSWTLLGRSEYHPWDELREIYRSVRMLSLYARQAELMLVFDHDVRVVFDQGLSDFFPMATLVEAIVTDRLLPSYRNMLSQEGADFGPVVLQRQGIRVIGRELLWEEVATCGIREGNLVVTEEDQTEVSVPFEAIPNYLILLRLIEELRQSISARTTPREL